MSKKLTDVVKEFYYHRESGRYPADFTVEVELARYDAAIARTPKLTAIQLAQMADTMKGGRDYKLGPDLGLSVSMSLGHICPDWDLERKGWNGKEPLEDWYSRHIRSFNSTMLERACLRARRAVGFNSYYQLESSKSWQKLEGALPCDWYGINPQYTSHWTIDAPDDEVKRALSP